MSFGVPYFERLATKHEDEASRLLKEAISWDSDPHNIEKDNMVVAVAQAHATLALSYRTAELKRTT